MPNVDDGALGTHWKGCHEVHNECHPMILALDASSTNVGWCLARGEKYVNSGVFSPAGDHPYKRVAQIAIWASQMLGHHDPDYVAIEEPMGHHKNLKTDRLLARTCGNIEGICTIRGIPTLWIHPKTVRKTGFHKNACHAAANLIGRTERYPVPPDEADAIGIWQATLGMLQEYGFMNLIAHEGE